MRTIPLIPVCLLVGLISGCAEPELSRRFETDLTDWKDVGKQAVKLSYFTTAVTSDSQPFLLKLSDRGQSAYIDAVAKEPEKAKQILAALTGKRSSGVNRDLSLFEKRLIMTIDPLNFRPGDRLADTKVRLELVGDAEFVSWSKFANEFGDVDLGTITLAQGNTFNAELSATVPAAGPFTDIGTTLSGSATRNLTEVLPLKRSFVKISGALDKKEATLTQRGDVGIDLSGTSSMDLAIRVKEAPKANGYIYTFSGLDAKAEPGKDEPADPKTVRVTIDHVRLPAQACPVKANIFFESAIREVVSGADTVIEGDDTIRYVPQPPPDKPLTVDLVKPEDIQTLLWVLEVRHSGDTVGIRSDLDPKTSESWATAYLGSEGEADELRQWLADLKTPPRRLRNADIGTMLGEPLTSADIDDLQVRPALELAEGVIEKCPEQ